VCAAVSTDAGLVLPRYSLCHTSVVHSVDFTRSVVVSGSRDATVKVSLGRRRSRSVKVIEYQSVIDTVSHVSV